ncbi:uncharacterized protein VNE69_04165 [Vairimorpha necatrix]|uniref:Uncharacterized protein n=1 Tax=Vairimorpha necatrix TaxID=6039 RepID=A0AAX4JBH9_9MICR
MISLTTTEKLLIATAYDLYGESNNSQISKFLKHNNIFFENIPDLYHIIKKESFQNGYSSPRDYCQDLRSQKAICEYEKYKNLIYAVLENKINLSNFNIPEFEIINLGQETSLFKKYIKESLDTNFLTDSLLNQEIKINDVPQIEPKNINKNIKIKIDSPKNIKDKKRFYIRMDEEEKIIDDYFDYLDVKNLEGTKLEINKINKNLLLENHPLINKIREKKDKINKVKIFTDENIKREKIEEIQSPFDNLMYKIQNTKKLEKDKTNWKNELKIILDHFSPIFGRNGNFIPIYENLEFSNLQQTIMAVMLIIQDTMILEEDEERLEMCSEYKKKLGSYADYYKK